MAGFIIKTKQASKQIAALVMLLLMVGWGKADSARQDVLVLKGVLKRTEPKFATFNQTNYFEISYTTNFYSIRTYDNRTNLVSQEFFDGKDFGSWRRAAPGVTNSIPAGFIWNTGTKIKEWPLTYEESVLLSVLALACPDIKTTILDNYTNYYTKYIDCVPLVVWDKEKLAQIEKNGFTVPKGVQKADSVMQNGLLASRNYFIAAVGSDHGILTNNYCRIVYSNYEKLDGTWIPRGIRIHDGNLMAPMDVNWVIEMGTPVRQGISKNSIYPDLSLGNTRIQDMRAGRRYDYIREGPWPSPLTETF